MAVSALCASFPLELLRTLSALTNVELLVIYTPEMSFASFRAMFAGSAPAERGDRDAKLEVAPVSCLGAVDLNEEVRKAMVRMLMKASDLGCCAKPWPVAKHW